MSTYKRTLGEADAASSQQYADALAKSKEYLQGFEARNVYNLEEIGLFYHLQLAKTVSAKRICGT